ncbi:MAG: hypothetical protein ACE5FL_15775, partial [Myxococcota bacterium]
FVGGGTTFVLLSQLQRLEDTPLAKRATAIAEGLPSCAWVEAQRSEGPPLDVLSQLRCRGATSALQGLERERADRDLVFALPGQGQERTRGTLAIDPSGTVDIDLLLPRSAFSGVRALMLPGGEPPGPPVLSHRDELVHARLRPQGGLDLAALVPDGGQADRMFQLKSRLFSGTVLDGAWEAAVYLPESGRAMPRAALAAGFRAARPAAAAMDRFVSELEATWPVRRSPFTVGAAEGACLLELNLLPDLAPCYVVTEHALVIGWNPASVRAALDAEDPGSAEAPHPMGGLTVDLARVPEADARFAQLAAPGTAPPPSRSLPWKQLTAEGATDGERVHVHVQLDAGTGT